MVADNGSFVYWLASMKTEALFHSYTAVGMEKAACAFAVLTNLTRYLIKRHTLSRPWYGLSLGKVFPMARTSFRLCRPHGGRFAKLQHGRLAADIIRQSIHT